MSTVRSALDALEATATTPDEQVFAQIRHPDRVRVWLAPGYFRRASAADFEWQFTRLAKLLFVARMKAYYRARSEDFQMTVMREPSSFGRQDIEYVEARSHLVVEGADPCGLVTVTAVGMEAWTVRIDHSQWADVDEAGLCEAASTAASRLVAHQFARIVELKSDIYSD